MRSFGRVGALAVLFLAVAAVDATADEQVIPVDKVPPAVIKAVKAKFPGAKIRHAEKDDSDGKIVYEITLLEADEDDEDETIDVSLTPEGKILSIEKMIDEEDLPAKVLAAVKAKYPKGEIETIEEVTEGDKVTYEVLLEDEAADNEKVEVLLDKSGKILKVTEVEEEKGEKKEKEEKGEKKEKKDKD